MSANESNGDIPDEIFSSKGDIPPKPSRPFTEYNIFFQLERNYILQTSDKSSHIDTTEQFAEVDPDGDTRPPRYRSLVLPKEWYTKGSRPKCRSHRKSHGKVTFMELTKLISKRWRDVDAVTKGYCRDLAKTELKKFREVTKAYVEMYGPEALKVRKKKKKKRDKNDKGSGKGVGGDKKGLPSSREVEHENQGGNGTTNAMDQDHNMINSFLLEHRASLPMMDAVPIQASTIKTFLNNRGPINLTSFAPQISPAAIAQQYPIEKPSRQAIEEINRQQAYLDYQSQLLQMRKSQMQLHSRMDRTLELMKMQQTQATQAQVNVFPQEASMMTQMFPQEEPTPGMGLSTRHLRNKGNVNASTGRRGSMTTADDQGNMPLLFGLLNDAVEDYKSITNTATLSRPICQTKQSQGSSAAIPSLLNDVVDDYNSSISTAKIRGPSNPTKQSQIMYSAESLAHGSPKRGKFDDTNKILESSKNPSDDCSAVWHSSPHMFPPPPLREGKTNEEIELPPSPGSPRRRSASLVPEHNIAPQISNLAKNFVNKFSKYLIHRHEVEQGEIDAIDALANLVDRQGAKKQALDPDLDNNITQYNTEGGQQELREGREDMEEVNRTNKDALLTLAHMQYCMPLKASNPRVNHGQDNLGPSKISDVSKPKNNDAFTTAASAYEVSKPSNQLYRQQMFCTTSPSDVMEGGVIDGGNAQKTKGPPAVLPHLGKRCFDLT